MQALVSYCRAGFENDCAAELQQQSASLGVFGYCQTEANSGYVLYHCQAEEADHLARKLALTSLVFSRQIFALLARLPELPSQDRISAIQLALLDDGLTDSINQLKPFGALHVDHPDSDLGNPLSAFCRKFTVPLRQALRRDGWLTASVSDRRPTLHVLFTTGSSAFIGYSYSYNQSPWQMGIVRLRMPSDAPSRSCLKLDEAFQLFVPAHEREARISSGMNAVDLGAAPGGWTYQLVRRGMMVQAVDNGAMDPTLMETGQVKHIREDGFKYRPKKKNVTWLVCDMVEKPLRVSQLMAQWFIDGDCQEAIFNLKLPMKKRFAMVDECLTLLKTSLAEQGSGRYEVQAKQLYHDREEVTVHVRRC